MHLYINNSKYRYMIRHWDIFSPSTISGPINDIFVSLAPFRGWINRIGPVATTNDVTYVTPSYVVDHSPRVGQARHFRSWPRGWINRIGPVAIFNVSGPSYEIVYMPELGHLLCVCRVDISILSGPLKCEERKEVISVGKYSIYQ